MFKKNNSNWSTKKANVEEDMNNYWDTDNIDDSLVNFGISDDDLDILLNEVTNGHNPSPAAKKAIEGVDQKGLANLLVRIFTIAMKRSCVSESLIPAAFDLISEILDISVLTNSEPGENHILSFCLKTLEKTSISEEHWEELPDILAVSYVRWHVTHCVGEILVKWLAAQSEEEVTMKHEKVIIGRGLNNCKVLLDKIGGRICTDLPGRFVQLQQTAKKLLLGEECRNREELLEIVIMLSAVKEREAIGHEEEGKLDNQKYDDEDEDDAYEELISFAELEKLKQKLEGRKPSKIIKLMSPSQFENIDYEENIDDVNNNKSTEDIGNPWGPMDIDIDTDRSEKLLKPDNQFSSGIDVEMSKLSMLDISDINGKPQKQSLKLAPSNNSKNANDSPTILAKYDSKGRKLLGYLESLDNLKDPKSSAYPVTGGCYLGRLPSCQVTIDGPKVSRIHATIYKTVDGIFLQTLSKTNCCCVNNNVIGTGKFVRIANGDKVAIGGIPYVWIEIGEKDEKAINKVKKEGEEQEIEMLEKGLNMKELNGPTMKHEGSTNSKAALSGNMRKKNRSKLNVAAVIEASLKKTEKSVPSAEIFSDSGIISEAPMKLPDLSVPPPSIISEMMENNNQATNNAGGENNLDTLATDKEKDVSFGESRSSTGKPFVFGLSQSQKIRPPNFAIPPPNGDITTQKKKENKRKYDTPKMQGKVGSIQFHTQMLDKKSLKSKRSPSSSRSDLSGKKFILPSPGKQITPEIVASSMNVTGQWEENKRQDKRDLFKIKMPKKVQESDDVVIESERFITDY